MATTEKIRRDIEKVREKIAEQQKRLRALEAQLAEEENLEIAIRHTSAASGSLRLRPFSISSSALGLSKKERLPGLPFCVEW